jgi:hypothetical protein
MGLISQIPYTLMTDKNNVNMMLGFWIVLKILKLVHKCKPKYKLIAIIAGAIRCEIAKIDYGGYSPIITVLLMNYASHPVWWVARSIVNLTYTAGCGWWSQIFAIAPLIILTIYQSPTKSEPPSKSEKNFYYWFYPIHMAMLAALKTIL